MKRKLIFNPVNLLAALFVPTALLWSGVATSQSRSTEAMPLSKLAGSWKGDGWALRQKGETKEGVRCRLKANYKSQSRRLALSGKCAATSGTYTLLGHIADYPGTNRVTGRWVNPSGVGSVKIAGTRAGNRMTFFFDSKDATTKKKVRYKTVWDLGDNTFSLSTGLGKGSSDALGKITFKR